MTTNALEECFYIDTLEEEEYNRNLKECMFIVFDPYIINIEDIEDMKPGCIVKVKMTTNALEEEKYKEVKQLCERS